MLKRNLKKTGLVSTGSLLIIALVSVAATHQTGNTGLRAISDTASGLLYFDTSLLKLNGICETGVLDVPSITMNKQAKKYVSDYLANKNNREMLQKIQAKSPNSFKVIDAVFTRYKLPVELKYLAVIESQLKTTALSRVGARGVWQLMPETARLLSLKVTKKYDERTHLYKSTVAAAKYLNDLYKLYGDWPLVIAAYNSGPGRVNEAIKKSGSRNFWKLQHYLPAETRGHVKKFISTHYFFEGEGSVTTLTKDEVAAYKKVMLAFVAKQNTLLKEKLDTSLVAEESPVDEKNSIARAETIGELKLNEKVK
ncbi:MAG TPA: lytic transglycosylase domain-containing protein [Chitinophagaceae bacterium]